MSPKASRHSARRPHQCVSGQTDRCRTVEYGSLGHRPLLAGFAATVLAAVVAATPLAPEAWAQVHQLVCRMVLLFRQTHMPCQAHLCGRPRLAQPGLPAS